MAKRKVNDKTTDDSLVRVNFDIPLETREAFNALCRSESIAANSAMRSLYENALQRRTVAPPVTLNYPAEVTEAAAKLGMTLDAFILDSVIQRAETVLNGDGTRGSATAKLAAKVAAIMKHNAESELLDRVEITMSLLSKKESEHPFGTGSNRKVIARFLSVNADRIAEHHKKYDIEPGHNVRAYHLKKHDANL